MGYERGVSRRRINIFWGMEGGPLGRPAWAGEMPLRNIFRQDGTGFSNSRCHKQSSLRPVFAAANKKYPNQPSVEAGSDNGKRKKSEQEM